MKQFLKSVLAVIAFSPIATQLANATPTNGHLDLIEPGLIMNQPISGATACANAFATASAAEITGCLQLGLGPSVENNHNNIIDNNILIDINAANINTNTSNINTNTTNINTNKANINTNEAYINKLGEGVAGSTALTAALSVLPQLSQDSKTNCGIGTGTYSSRYAVSFGCASKVSERFDINAGGSYIFGGSRDYVGGKLDNGALKAGFVFKLGKLNKPTQLNSKDMKTIENKISLLEKNNDELKTQNDQLLARLENLEKLTLALKLNPNHEVISLVK